MGSVMIKNVKEHKHALLYLGILCIAVGFFLSMSVDIYADVGNNHRYGGDSNSGSSSGGGGGDSFFVFYMFTSILRMFGPMGIIIFGIILLGVFYFIRKNAGKINPGGNPINNSSMNRDTYFDNEADIIKTITEQDSAFSAEEFKQFASECFVTLQTAWTARDWSSIRPFESETLFNMHNRQLQEYINNKTINVMERVNVQSTRIISHAIQGDKEVVSIALRAVMRDYIVDETTRQVIEGDRLKDFHTNYRLEFIRTNGVKTTSGKQLSTTNCPNCGAPTAITSSGRCEYCDSVITTGDYSWVLNELTTI